jgi:hypothetical protein
MTGVFVAWSRYRNSPGWIEDGSGCHIWIGARSQDGYAHGWDAENHCNGAIHRIRYRREVGPIPVGMELDHYVCSNGAGGCCNPHHCRPVTPRENSLRSGAQSSLNAAKTHCPQGHPLSGENLIKYYVERRGMRCCRTCGQQERRRYKAAHREERRVKARAYRLARRKAA